MVASSFKGCSGFIPDQPTPSAVGQPLASQVQAKAADVISVFNSQVQTDGVSCADNGSSSQSDLYRTQWNRHIDGANYLMADGHAKWYRIEQTLDDGFLWGTAWYPAYTKNP